MNQTDKKWFAVRTKPHQEELASTHYSNQGFEVYAPKVEATRRHARRTEKVLRPLFPGYIFLHLEPEQRDWTAISSTIGALGPVRFGDNCPPVPEKVIEGIRARENSSGCIPLQTIGNRFLKAGARVTVALGDKDLEGIFLNFRDEDRVLVLLDMLQRQLPVEISLAELQVA